MEILPPPDYPPLSPSEYPQIPTRTSATTLENLHDSFVGGDIQKFREILDTQNSSSDEFDIRDLHTIFTEAIKLDEVQFIQELFDRGYPMNALFALDAIKVKGKNVLDTFINRGWDINEPISQLQPPILG